MSALKNILCLGFVTALIASCNDHHVAPQPPLSITDAPTPSSEHQADLSPSDTSPGDAPLADSCPAHSSPGEIITSSTADAPNELENVASEPNCAETHYVYGLSIKDIKIDDVNPDFLVNDQDGDITFELNVTYPSVRTDESGAILSEETSMRWLGAESLHMWDKSTFLISNFPPHKVSNARAPLWNLSLLNSEAQFVFTLEKLIDDDVSVWMMSQDDNLLMEDLSSRTFEILVNDIPPFDSEGNSVMTLSFMGAEKNKIHMCVVLSRRDHPSQVSTPTPAESKWFRSSKYF